MKAATLSILASLASLTVAIAVPLEKRVLVTETVTDVVVTTVESTTTVWVKPPKPTHAAHLAQHAHHQAHKHEGPAGPPKKAAAPAPAPEHTSEPTPIAPPESSSPLAVINKAPAPAPAPAVMSPQQPPPGVEQAAKQAAPAQGPATNQAASPPASPPQPPISPVVPPPVRQANSNSETNINAGSTTDCGEVGMPCAGDITFYDTGLGACGWTNDGTAENVFALAHEMMGSQSNGNPFCGRQAEVSLDGKTVIGKLVDKCGGCKGQDIDLSHAMFQALANEDSGRISNVKWHFID
ncbi:MAG: hypothetical protein LQ345_003534 [Seirophora villosa]|nr:MAG: hypothetical protein LQ345_003534 [Seirophora villosa]